MGNDSNDCYINTKTFQIKEFTMSDIKLSRAEYTEQSIWTSVGKQGFKPIKGRFVGLGRNGKVYPVNHVAVLPPETPGNVGTSPDFVGSFVVVVDVVPLNDGVGNIGKVRIAATTGMQILLGGGSFVENLKAIHGGAAMKIVKTGADKGKLTIASAGDSYNCIVEIVNSLQEYVLVRLGFQTLEGTASGAATAADDVVVINPDLDKNLDGVVDAKEILDTDADGDTDWHDAVNILSDNVTD